jgi:hypothetical protein
LIAAVFVFPIILKTTNPTQQIRQFTQGGEHPEGFTEFRRRRPEHGLTGRNVLDDPRLGPDFGSGPYLQVVGYPDLAPGKHTVPQGTTTGNSGLGTQGTHFTNAHIVSYLA